MFLFRVKLIQEPKETDNSGQKTQLIVIVVVADLPCSSMQSSGEVTDSAQASSEGQRAFIEHPRQ